MRYLLDTHVFLWLAMRPELVGPRIDQLHDPRTELLLSAVASWEIAIKHGLGRLDLPDGPARWVQRQLHEMGVTPVPVEHADALAVASLPLVHRDPFDRLLVATSSNLRVPLVTADPVFAGYDIDVVSVG